MPDSSTRDDAGSRRRAALVIATTWIAAFLVSLDYTAITVALPTLAAEFEVGTSRVSWASLSYMLTMSALTLAAGAVRKDRAMTQAWLERAAAPNLLDAVADPGLVFCFVLANLMSPHFWELAARLREPAPEESAVSGPERIRELIDRHYEHVTPARIFETNGLLDLDRESERPGLSLVDYASASILKNFEWRVQHGTYWPTTFTSTF